jgi:hypothetical protein
MHADEADADADDDARGDEQEGQGVHRAQGSSGGRVGDRSRAPERDGWERRPTFRALTTDELVAFRDLLRRLARPG